MNWILKPWSELTTDELYELLALRAEVFVVEQSCPFQDLDGLDRREGVWHLQGYEGEHLAAYARIMAPGIGDDSGAAIGRVVTSPRSRGGGLGHSLIGEAVIACTARWPAYSIWLGAQAHLQGFYGQHGFAPEGEGYVEDDIPHIGMRKLPG
ncbi:GNAT family acetyltransferase [Aeromonas hydrophila 4AK4]|nr:GNAT family acetyltransferase [Aeromonas hydrophila 4AK4]